MNFLLIALPSAQSKMKEQFLELQDALIKTKQFVATLNDKMEQLTEDKSELQKRLDTLENMFASYKEKMTSSNFIKTYWNIEIFSVVSCLSQKDRVSNLRFKE